MIDCAYCVDPLADATDEHVFAQSIGGSRFVVPTHRACNARANWLIDGRLGLCSHIRRARAALGVVDPRTGVAYAYDLLGATVAAMQLPEGNHAGSEADSISALLAAKPSHAFDGARVLFRLTRDEIKTRLISNPTTAFDGLPTRWANATQHEDTGSGALAAEHMLAVVKATSRCTHGPALWSRFAAKVGLGLLSELSARKLRGEKGEIVNGIRWGGLAEARSRLRQIAFGADPPLQAEPVSFQGHTELRAAHLAAMTTVGETTMIGVVLFGHLGARVTIPGILLGDLPEIDFREPVVRGRDADDAPPDWWRFVQGSLRGPT